MDYTTVKFFKDGFFGYGEEGNFRIASIWHILPILFMLIMIYIIYKNKDKLRNYKYEGRIRFIYAFIMLIVEMSFFWRLSYVGTQGAYDTMLTYLPLQLCQWGLIISVFTILSKNEKLFSMNFYITLLFANIALIYPLVITNAGPTYYRYYQFWLEHIMPIIGVFYMIFVHDFKPDKKGILRTLYLIIPITIIALIANANIEGARYLYLTLKVPFLPDSQYLKAPILFALTMFIFYLMYLLFNLIQKNKD